MISEELLLKDIGELADDLDLEVYVVGGYVRDKLLNRESKDLDFVVIGDGPEFAKALAKKFKTEKIVIYEKFGTAMIPYYLYLLEFVSARAESYNDDSRNPVVEEADFKTDIMRRDFTVNAMAFGLNKNNFGELVDLLGGQEDMEKKILRTPLDPEKTFYDDPLRIMRAIRFAAQLGFEIEENAYKAISKFADRLEIISVERITEEFFKIMKSDRASFGLELLKETGILKIILPELDRLEIDDDENKGHHKNVWEHTLKVLDNVSAKSKSLTVRLAALFHDIGKFDTREFKEGKGWTFYNHDFIGGKMIIPIFKKLKISKEITLKVKKLVALHMRPISLAESSAEITDSAIRRLVVKAGEDLEDALLLSSSDLTSKNPKKVERKRKRFQFILDRIDEVEELDKLRAFQSPVRGEEIMEITGLSPGPEIGKYKHLIEEAILEGEIPNEYDAAKKYLLKILDNN